MNELQYTEQALCDVERVCDFLLATDPIAAPATADVILEALNILMHSPEIGRRVAHGNRELVISRGRTGYLALYRFFPERQSVLVLAVRHQREAGYKQ